MMIKNSLTLFNRICSIFNLASRFLAISANFSLASVIWVLFLEIILFLASVIGIFGLGITFLPLLVGSAFFDLKRVYFEVYAYHESAIISYAYFKLLTWYFLASFSG